MSLDEILEKILADTRPARKSTNGADLLDSNGDRVGSWLGFSSARRNRRTGTLVVVIDDRSGAFSSDSLDDPTGDGPCSWWTVCDDHAQLVMHRTRKDAERHAADPEGWCERCNGEALS